MELQQPFLDAVRRIHLATDALERTLGLDVPRSAPMERTRR